MDGVATGLSVGTAGVLVSIETQLQVFGKRHGPGVIGQGDYRRHLLRERGRDGGREGRI